MYTDVNTRAAGISRHKNGDFLFLKTVFVDVFLVNWPFDVTQQCSHYQIDPKTTPHIVAIGQNMYHKFGLCYLYRDYKLVTCLIIVVIAYTGNLAPALLYSVN